MLAVFANGCSREKENRPENEASTTQLESPQAAKLRQNAEGALTAIAELEKKKDVTCWTSFRQLDWFIAEKSYSEFGTLAKIRAAKALVRGAWEKAARASSGEVITAAEFDAAVVLPTVELAAAQKRELSAFANDIGVRNYTDYQKTAEHWRVVLSVLQDELHTGARLKPFEAEALPRLADAATVLSLHLLKRSGAAAADAKSAMVEGVHVQKAYRELARELGIEASSPGGGERLTAEQVAARMRPLTRTLIDGKVKALKSFNHARELAADLNRVQVSKLPIEPDAARNMRLQLQSFAMFVASGFVPMRGDNFLSDGSFEKAALPRLAYLDDVHVQNAIMQLFPHHTLNNGDVVVRFEPNPGPIVGDRKFEPFEVRMLDHQMNGVRDSALHWLVLANAWKEKPFAIDPFAAEYLSEVISMMATLWLIRGDQIARELGKSSIDNDVIRRIHSNTYVMVPPVSESATEWGPAEAGAKRKALSGYPNKLFRDATATSGLEPPTVTAAPKQAAPQNQFDLQSFMGGGIAVGDIDRDGFPDLYLAGEGQGRLYRNRGKAAPGQFEDVTKAWGLTGPMVDSHGSLFFDMDGDGDDDLLILRAENRSLMLRNDGGRFSDASEATGIKTGRGAHVATVFDFDQDGDLDIYIGYYGSHRHHRGQSQRNVPSMDGRNGSPNQLWQRQEDGTYRDVAAEVGVADVGWTLAVAVFDYERDGDLDLYLANDFGANSLYQNIGDGRFSDITVKAGVGDRGSGMNVDFTDVNGDGAWDIYVSNIDMFHKRIKVIFPRDDSTIDIDESLVRGFQYLSGNKLYVSAESGGRFESREGIMFEPGDRGWGWDAAFFDYENDGDDDLYLTNGWVDGSYAGQQANQMFIRGGDHYFVGPTASPEAFVGNSRSTAAVDVDRDGDIDLVTNNFRSAPRLLINTQSAGNRYVQLDIRSGGKNPQAIGALISIRAGDRTILRHRMTGRGYLSQADPLITAGVGRASSVDVTVWWPDGEKSEFPALATNSRHELTQKPASR